jgi:hypothetical protein
MSPPNGEALSKKNGVFWMLRRVALVRTEVSEEPSSYFIRVTRIDELGTTLAVTSNRRTLRRNTNKQHRPDMEDGCEYSYIESATADIRQGVLLQLGGWVLADNSSL